MMSDDTTRHSWEQQDGEPSTWYAKFTTYRLLGRGRSMQKAWESDGKRQKTTEVSSTWRMMAQEWNWKERAADWDIFVAEEDAAKQAEQRRTLARSAFAFLARKLPELEDQRVTPRTYAEMMRIIFDELRTEYGQQPAAKVDLNVTFDQVVEHIAKARGLDPVELKARSRERADKIGLP